jgi:VIT1/CCC1 family predicted Fe2+/Mn2+ transporter
VTRADRAEAVFGLFDGLTSALGLTLVAASRLSAHAVISTAAALAVGAGASMAAGEYLHDEHGRLRPAAVNGCATALGVLLPALPWLALRGLGAYAATLAIAACLGGLIARLRPERGLASLLRTFGVLIPVAFLSTLSGGLA